MPKPQLVVYLRSKYSPFHLDEKQTERIVPWFPQWNLSIASTYEEFCQLLPTAQAVLTWHFGPELYEQAPQLQAVSTPAAGKDWVAADPKGKVPTLYGGFHGPMIAESFLGMLLYFNNGYHLARQAQQHCQWQRTTAPIRKLLAKQTILIIGYGRIGQSVAQSLVPFGPRLIGIRQNPQMSQDSGIEVFGMQDLDRLLSQCDHCLLLLPSGEATQNLMSKPQFEKLPPHAYLYNFGRGSTVCEDSLLQALQMQQIAGCGLDVFAQEPLAASSPLWQHPNVLLTPHSSCFYADYLENYFAEIAPRLSNLLTDEPAHCTHDNHSHR